MSDQPTAGWPQPDGTMIRILDDAIARTTERYPVAGALMTALDTLPKRVRLQFEADLCNQMGIALRINGII